jgi:hypothetical protein
LDKARLYAIVKVVWTLAVIACGVYYFAVNYAVAVDYIQTINSSRLLISFVFILIMRSLHPHLVQRTLALVDFDLAFGQVFSIVSISQLGKYIPGGIWQFVARFSAYRQNQLSYKDMGKSFIIENVWLVLGSFLVGMCFVFVAGPAILLQLFGASPDSNNLPGLAWLSLSVWLLVLFATEFAFKSASRQPSAPAASRQFISQTSMWVFLGLSFAILFQNIASFDDFCLISGVFILSFLAGYLAIFAPGGIGVREYVAVLLLSALFSSAEIGIVTIIHRLLYTLAEFLLAGLSLLLNRSRRFAAQAPAPSAAQEEQLNKV